MIKMSRKAKKAMAVALTAGMLASTATTPVFAAGEGWKQNATGWWYENADGTYPASKWQKIGEKWYYFDANGYMVSGWQSINGNWYYFGGANDGAMKDGWFQDTTGKWSYADAGNGAIYVNKWAKSGSDWYYLADKGYMQEGGWVEDKAAGTWYFVDKAGVMQTGIVKVEDKVYYLEKNGAMVVGEKTINGVVYTFDASGKATGDKIPTPTKAFKTDGTSVALDPEEKELSVTSVTAITKNADGDFIVTALLNKDVTADTLKDTTLTLTNGSIVATAKFDSVTGATVVYKISNPGVLTPGDSSADGSYAVTSANIDVATGLTAGYEETLVGNSIQGFVYYDDNGTFKFISNATVKVGNKTVTTNDKGFYTIPATSGYPDVVVSADNFFGKTAKTMVSRNYPSTQNVELTKYDREQLYINGTIIDSAENTGVANVKVELQKKGTDGKFTTIATAASYIDGTFAFGNSACAVIGSDGEILDGAGQTDLDGVVIFKDDDANRLSKDETYQLVISKEYNKAIDTNDSTKSSLYDAYQTKTIAVTLNTTAAQTNLKSISLTHVKELSGATIDMSWNKNATAPVAATQALTISLMDQDGKTLLETANINVNVDTENNAMKNAENLIKADSLFPKAPRLPEGTYYFVVNDGTNAFYVQAVTVKDGEAVAVKGEFQKANAGKVITNVEKIKYEDKVMGANTTGQNANIIKWDTNTEDYVDSGKDLTVTYDVYQKVNNVNVLVDTVKKTDDENQKVKFDYTLDSNHPVVSATTPLKQLSEGKDYVCIPTQDYISAEGVVTIEGVAAVNNKTNNVLPAANITAIDLTAEDGGNVINWVDSEGQSLFGATDLTVKISSLKIVDATDSTKVIKEVKNMENVTIKEDGSAFEITDSDDKKALAGIPVGEYKAIIEVEGYAPVTTEKFTLIDFENACLTTDKQFKKNAITTITGYIRYADDNTEVGGSDQDTTLADALVLLYDSTGNVVAYDIIGSTTGGNATNYKIEAGIDTKANKVKLTAGTYKLVVRGANFETVTKDVVLKENETVTYNLDVTRHTAGKVVLTVRDTNNYGFGTGYTDFDASHTVPDLTPVLRDANYVTPDDDNFDKNDVIKYLAGLANTIVPDYLYGEFVTEQRDYSDVEYYTKDLKLSVGNYNIWVPATDKAYEEKSTVTIAAIDNTAYKNVVTTAKTSGKTTKLTVNFDSTHVAPTITSNDVVVVEDVNGKVLDQKFVTLDSNYGDFVVFDVVEDATYVVKVYSQGNFVGSQKVTVQGIAKSVTVALDQANNE